MRSNMANTAKQFVYDTLLSVARTLRLAENPDVRIEAANMEKELGSRLALLGDKRKRPDSNQLRKGSPI
jgi:hypothetical protein